MLTPIKIDCKLNFLKNNMKTSEIIRGDIFIIPNPVDKFDPEWVNGGNLKFWSEVADQFHAIKYDPAYKDQFKDIRFDDEKYVQVWFLTRGHSHSSWRDHGIDGYNELKGAYPVVSWLPATLFSNKKEGDTVTFDLVIEKNPRWSNPKWVIVEDKYLNNEISESEYKAQIAELKKSKEYDPSLEIKTRVKVSLTLNQKDYRYSSFGKFEEVLEKLINK